MYYKPSWRLLLMLGFSCMSYAITGLLLKYSNSIIDAYNRKLFLNERAVIAELLIFQSYLSLCTDVMFYNWELDKVKPRIFLYADRIVAICIAVLTMCEAYRLTLSDISICAFLSTFCLSAFLFGRYYRKQMRLHNTYQYMMVTQTSAARYCKQYVACHIVWHILPFLWLIWLLIS